MKECTEKCCYPKEVDPFLALEPHAKPCRRRHPARCSPSEGPCCNEQCQFETTKKLCRQESECNHKAYCTGGNATCPHPHPKPDKTECNGGTQVCWQGQCVGSICQKYDFEGRFNAQIPLIRSLAISRQLMNLSIPQSASLPPNLAPSLMRCAK